ncbi:hypothetical protein [Streptomyces sp. NPDC058240]|uniref:hypothetical protein n=1 Tax=Streptomyces sp. NPDC058240 TaxID=3346396 RepID=UPI0036EFD325
MSEAHRRITDVRAMTDVQKSVQLILRGLLHTTSMSTPRTDHTSPLTWDFKFALGPPALSLSFIYQDLPGLPMAFDLGPQQRMQPPKVDLRGPGHRHGTRAPALEGVLVLIAERRD